LHRKEILRRLTGALLASTLMTTAAVADDFVKGMMGAMIGAAIANQGNSGGRVKNRSSRSSAPSPERLKNKELQEALNYFGYNVGRPDGVLGQQSRRGISQFQACVNRPITGAFDSFEEQFLKNSYFRAQASATETLRIVAGKPNGYCGLLQQYFLELQGGGQQQPAAAAPIQVQPQQPTVVVQQAPVVVQQQNTTVQNTTVVLIDGDLQARYDYTITQLKLFEQIERQISAKAKNASSERKLSTVKERLNELRSSIREIEIEVKGKYGTPIRPTNANLGVTAVKASEVFPRVPYYIPGTTETGELWIKPYVTDEGLLTYDFNFVAEFSDFEKIKDTLTMNSEHVMAVADALVKVTEWSDTAIQKGMRRSYEKSAYCYPQVMCGKNEAGNNSAEVIFVLYDDGSTAVRLQENKGKFRSGYNLSVESGLLLSAYMDYMVEIGENEFEANTMTDAELDSVFKD
jgi:peptidoglycan hydrolase-like protein with peptidoglycan-binding domain